MASGSSGLLSQRTRLYKRLAYSQGSLVNGDIVARVEWKARNEWKEAREEGREEGRREERIKEAENKAQVREKTRRKKGRKKGRKKRP